ncbi:RNA-directed DNA polymerase, eukaryota, reverse transcriptase zinc-binding domain protein [Tanacetum coccineum]
MEKDDSNKDIRSLADDLAARLDKIRDGPPKNKLLTHGRVLRREKALQFPASSELCYKKTPNPFFWATLGFFKEIMRDDMDSSTQVRTDDSLTKDNVTKVPVWAKIHKVPVVAYMEDGLSLIGTQIGKPIMLDTFTSSMCGDTCGRMRYARALIEVSADKELKQEVVMGVPLEDGTGHKIERMKVEYEWKPPVCIDCHIFGHSNSQCPKRAPIEVVADVNEPTHVSRQSHVDVSLLSKVCSRVFKYREWTSNANCCTSGCRIIVGWNTDVFELMVLAQTDQVMHVKVTHKTDNKTFFCSFVYASNSTTTRRLLWNDLGVHKLVTRNSPWILMGDFNVALNLEDICLGSSIPNSPMYEFKDCISKIEVMDINCSGLHFTWNQKPRGGHGILKKLDRIMGNLDFIDAFPGAYAVFQPYRISDHSPSVLKIPSLVSTKPKPFKFYNFLTHKPRFKELLFNTWSIQVDGHNMYKVVSKLKALKTPLRKLLHDQGNLHERVNLLRVELDTVQRALDANPMDTNLRDEEAVYLNAFNEAKLDEERFLRQKANVEWLEAGDSNSSYFHKMVKARNQYCRIKVILDSNNVEVAGALVPEVFVNHYEEFLGNHSVCDDLNIDGKSAYLICSDHTCPAEAVRASRDSVPYDSNPHETVFVAADRILKQSWLYEDQHYFFLHLETRQKQAAFLPPIRPSASTQRAHLTALDEVFDHILLESDALLMDQHVFALVVDDVVSIALAIQEGHMSDFDDNLDGDQNIDDYDMVGDTSSAQTRVGKDIQGIPWERLNITREGYMHTSMRTFPYPRRLLLRNTTQKSERVLQIESPTKVMCTPKDHGLATSKHDVYVTSNFKNAAPTEEDFKGSLFVRLDEEGVIFCTRTTYEDNAIPNAIEIYNSSSGGMYFMASNNDCCVREYEMAGFQLVNDFRFPWPVNIAYDDVEQRLMVFLLTHDIVNECIWSTNVAIRGVDSIAMDMKNKKLTITRDVDRVAIVLK